MVFDLVVGCCREYYDGILTPLNARVEVFIVLLGRIPGDRDAREQACSCAMQRIPDVACPRR